MDQEGERDLPMSAKKVLFYSICLIGVLSLLLSIISCSSHNPADKSPSKKTMDGADVESVKIKGVMISVGDNADTVNSQIGKGVLIVATNDPADQSSIIIFSTYVTEGKTYRISFCKAGKGYYHVCRISFVELPKKTGVDTQSEMDLNLNAEHHRRHDSINNSQSGSNIVTNDDLTKNRSKK